MAGSGLWDELARGGGSCRYLLKEKLLDWETGVLSQTIRNQPCKDVHVDISADTLRHVITLLLLEKEGTNESKNQK